VQVLQDLFYCFIARFILLVIAPLAVTMEMLQCLLRLLLLLTMLGDVLSATKKPPFRGETTAVPRGLDVLLDNLALSPRTPSGKPGRADNDHIARSSAGKFFRSNVQYTPPTPRQRNSTVASRRFRRCMCIGLK